MQPRLLPPNAVLDLAPSYALGIPAQNTVCATRIPCHGHVRRRHGDHRDLWDRLFHHPS
jgi:hypothetical protein